MEKHVDVVVVGAGPVGLLAAIELTLADVQVVVLERLDAPNTTIKALAVGPLGAEALRRRGMAAALAAEEARNLAEMEKFSDKTGWPLRGRAAKFSGHFGGLFIRKDAQSEPDRRPCLVDQQGLEKILTERALALGVEFHRGCEVVGIVPHAEGVEIEWRSVVGAGRIDCAHLIGCDGGRSTIRKLAGFDFPGTPPTMTMFHAIVEIDHPERLGGAGWHRTSGGVFAYGPFPGRLFLLDFSGPPADRLSPVTCEEVEGVLRRISGADVRVTALEVANRWTDNTRLVDTYRRGRVLLAGDAAHIHSPFGGQGLSLGLVDAANLGWKLAAVIRGDRPDGLLDTYTAERRPVAEAVLANTLAQAAIMRPDPESGAMRDLMATLMQSDDVSRTIGGMMSGVALRYDLGSERDDVGHLVGDRAVDGGSLYDLMQDGAGIFLDASSGAEASRVVAAVSPRIRRAAVDGDVSMLIRPDGCVAWAGSRNSIGGLETTLCRWFGSDLVAA